jgi:hypothetical protein
MLCNVKHVRPDPVEAERSHQSLYYVQLLLLVIRQLALIVITLDKCGNSKAVVTEELAVWVLPEYL